MITLTTEQAQQIEDALKYARNVCVGSNWSTYDADVALSVIRAARAHEQAEQEPVGEVVMESMGVGDAQIVRFRMNGRIPPVGTKLYAAPVRTKDLTDDEIMKINVDTASIVPTCDRQFHFARAVIAADRSKNK